ncbi:4832_t:CDS:2 [Paraglomus occultum]|uniref:4832_t:CDS:1 n=1 Tax=Paraglomus occultum TaxID=144539 RepID=A0A9N8WNZ0_9GLOM|nr:4832_t:CDS:2 [Paraglomus occultum]
MDYLSQERARGITITSAAITFAWRNYRINLIDTPGHADFTIEVERSIRVLDGAVTILDGVAGVEAQTQTVWAQADRYNVPRIAYVNKMDRVGARFGRTVRQIAKKLRTRTLVCQIPIMKKDARGENVFWGAVDLVEMDVLDWDQDVNGNIVKRIKLTEKYGDKSVYDEAVKGRMNLVEALSEMDDNILEIMLAEEDHMKVSAEEVRGALRRVTLSGKAVPVFCGASFRNRGVQPVLDAIVDYLPSPLDCAAPIGTLANGKNTVIPLKEKESLCALAFKVVHDHRRGSLVFVRVYSGTLNNRMSLYNTNTKTNERVNKLLKMHANDAEEIPCITAGNICALVGLKSTRTGDTLIQFNDSRKSLRLPSIEIPAPVFVCAVEPATVSDEKPLQEALENVLREDPSLHVINDEETGQTLISGMGELHLEIVRDRLLNDFKVRAEIGKMRISYRESIIDEIEHTCLYDKEIMGKRARVQMSLNISRLTEGDSGIAEEGGNRIELDLSQQSSPTQTPTQGPSLPPEDIATSIRSGLVSALYLI